MSYAIPERIVDKATVGYNPDGIVTNVVAFDPVTRAKHYNNHPSGIESINIVRCLNFDMGCALKYVMRRHGKEYDRSLKSAKYYLGDQHATGNQIVVNGAVYRLLEEYTSKEPELLVISFYMAFNAYCMQPTNKHYEMVVTFLDSIREAKV